MEEIELYNEKQRMCPKCGSYLCQELVENGGKFHLFCEEGDCEYDKILEPERIRFHFTYRDEFTTEVVAKNLEEAMKQIDDAAWQRTGYGLWNEYLEVECEPIIDEEQTSGA